MMHVIPHLEHGIGTFLPEGGMRAIPLHLEALAKCLGVTFLTDTPARRILHDRGRVTGVEDERGQVHKADWVVSNADLHPTYRRLLPDLKAPKRILDQERSTSGVIFYWGVKGTHEELGLHNILFSRDYAKEFSSIRDHGTPGDDPTVYINITSKELPQDAPEGHENWFVLMNVEANPEMWDDAAVAQLKHDVLAKIERTLAPPNIVCEQVLHPGAIESLTSSWRGHSMARRAIQRLRHSFVTAIAPQTSRGSTSAEEACTQAAASPCACLEPESWTNLHMQLHE